MRRAPVFALLLLLPFAFAGCDDGGGNPHLFSLTLEVVDGDGAPVEGLELVMVPDLPFYQDGKTPVAKAAVSIPFTVSRACSVHLMIEDVYGESVRLLLSQPIPAGQHMVAWNGRDGVGDEQATGVYKAHMRCNDEETGELLFEDSAPMFMAILDFDRRITGTTDARGRIEITDMRLFPHLCGAPEITARDENGEETGTIVFTPSMRIHLRDLGAGLFQRIDRDIEGPGELVLVWDPGKAAPENATPPVTTNGDRQSMPPAPFSLGPPRPIPFN